MATSSKDSELIYSLIQNTRRTKARHLKKGPLAVAKSIVGLFSTVEPRKAPSASKTEHGRLITIAASHFCEKGRWGLDLLEDDDTNNFYYSEDGHAPAFSSFFAVPASKDTASQTPMLILKEGTKGEELIYGSEDVLRKMCPFLYPKEIDKQIETMEKDLAQRLGTSTRLYAYHNMLHEDYYEGLCQVCTGQVTKVEAVLFEKMLPHGLNAGIRKGMEINEQNCTLAEKSIVEVFDEISGRLEKNGGKYIMDKSAEESYGFTAIDLSFAALASPLIRPPEMKALQCDDNKLPSHVLEFAKKLISTKAGQHVLRMYAEHRFGTFQSPEASNERIVKLRSSVRDRFPWPELALVSAGAVGVVVLGRKLLL